ncbi:MAG: MaoC family dehydratase [Elstera sp.]
MPLVPGPFFTLDHTPTQAELELFARVSGDDNPIHVDPAFSARTRFGRTVAHGMLIYSYFWAEMRRQLPNATVKRQSVMFPHPAYAGEAIRITATVESVEGGDARIAVRVARLADDTPVAEATTVLTVTEATTVLAVGVA